ncbi:DUF3137 domain-containing protein [bacterium]|nr:DUF3137 domain-containing protein [bacterium]
MEETKEKSYSKIKQDFYYRYSKYVIPILSNYDGDRKQTLVLAVIASSFLIILGIIFGIFMLTAKGSNHDIRLSAFLIIGGFCLYKMIKKNFEKKIKKKIMPVVCACFPKLKWREPEKQKNFFEKTKKMYSDEIFNNELANEYKTSSLIPNFARMFYDDCFDGEYNEVPFSIEENYAEIGSGKNRRTVFKGVIVSLKMNKNFKGNTVIRPDTMFHTSPSNILHHTVLEDVDFEKKFDVFTDDDVEARYLITPTLMERLKSMQVAFSANKISAAFYQNKFFIALHTNKDLFSLGSLTKNVCDREQFFTMFEEIFSIIKLIDHFKLDQKIGI